MNTNPGNNYPPRKPNKTNDPQMVLKGQVKICEKSDVIVFTIPLGLFDLVCIVPIPQNDSDTETDVYVKFKVRWNNRFPTAGAFRPRFQSSNRFQDENGDTEDEGTSNPSPLPNE